MREAFCEYGHHYNAEFYVLLEPESYITIDVLRFLAYAEVLDGLSATARNIFMVDARDALFQGDIFAEEWLPPLKRKAASLGVAVPYVIFTEEDAPLKSNINKEWVCSLWPPLVVLLFVAPEQSNTNLTHILFCPQSSAPLRARVREYVELDQPVACKANTVRKATWVPVEQNTEVLCLLARSSQCASIPLLLRLFKTTQFCARAQSWGATTLYKPICTSCWMLFCFTQRRRAWTGALDKQSPTTWRTGCSRGTLNFSTLRLFGSTTMTHLCTQSTSWQLWSSLMGVTLRCITSEVFGRLSCTNGTAVQSL